jgi:phosphatidylserine/phosphatidylglycerophosphate/cardiolipin synthase-like enzyme
MSTQKLSAFERVIVTTLADKAGLAASVLEAWADVPTASVQSARSLVNVAQLGLAEEGSTEEVLIRLAGLGLVDAIQHGFKARHDAREQFLRLALALFSIDFYQSAVHRDSTVAQVVLTRPPRPSALEEKLLDLGWRTASLDPTDHAFHDIVRAAQSRVVVMTPFFDVIGATWLRELLSHTAVGVERTLILRSLEDSTRKDYPVGLDAISPWLRANGIQVFNYSIRKLDGGRETFHAKSVLCDRNAAYLGSSNMTSASLEHSMEMGVVLKGRAAASVADVVDAVLAAGTRWI